MFNRLKWIAVSYFTCPATLTVVALSVALALCIAWVTPRFARNDLAPAPPKAGPVINTMADLKQARRQHRQAEIRGIDLLELYLSASREPLPADGPRSDLAGLLGEFPNVKWVNVGVFAAAENPTGLLAGLEQLKQLEYLSLDLQVPISDLSWLGSLPSLRWLEVSCTSHDPDLAGLAAAPSLETLAVMNINPLTEGLLSQIAGLTHLKTLILAPLPAPPNSIWPAGIHPADPSKFVILQNLPNLRAVYFGQWQFGDGQNPAIAVQAALPGVTVRPAVVITRSDLLPMLTSFICSLLAGALAYQLAAQFHGAANRLLPRIGLAHGLAAAVWWSATVATTGWFLAQIGFSAAVALMLAAALSTALVAGGTMLGMEFLRTQPTNRLALWALPGWSLMVLFLGIARPWWFEVYHGTTLYGGALATAAIGGWLIWRLGRNSEVAEAAARSQAGFPAIPSAGWRARLLDRSLRGREGQIESLSSGGVDRSWWGRIAKWRLGNTPQRTLRIWLVTLVVLAFVLVVQWRVFRSLEASLFAWRFALLGGACVLPIQAIATTLANWYWRTRLLPVESLRPLWNRDFRRQLATAVAIDLAPAALIFAAGAALAMNIDSESNIQWSRLPLSFVVFLTLGALGMAATTLILVARRRWLAGLILAAAALLTQFVVPYAALEHLRAAGQLPPNTAPSTTAFALAAESQLWIPILLAAPLAIWSAWRWRTMELSDFG